MHWTKWHKVGYVIIKLFEKDTYCFLIKYYLMYYGKDLFLTFFPRKCNFFQKVSSDLELPLFSFFFSLNSGKGWSRELFELKTFCTLFLQILEKSIFKSWCPAATKPRKLVVDIKQWNPPATEDSCSEFQRLLQCDVELKFSYLDACYKKIHLYQKLQLSRTYCYYCYWFKNTTYKTLSYIVYILVCTDDSKGMMVKRGK